MGVTDAYKWTLYSRLKTTDPGRGLQAALTCVAVARESANIYRGVKGSLPAIRAPVAVLTFPNDFVANGAPEKTPPCPGDLGQNDNA